MNQFTKLYYHTVHLGEKLMIPFLPYRQPEILEKVEEIASIFHKKKMTKVLLVTDKGIRSLGLTLPLEENLQSQGIEVAVFDETVPNPTIANIESARSMYLEHQCEAIIAFGGGSAMDCAKATGARIAKPNQSVSAMKGLLKVRKKIPLLIAIPTTAGTGSETTIAAVITDEKTHHKYPINDFSLIPAYAVLDERVTIGLPKHITSTTGMDALTHAVEAYIGGATTKQTRAMSIEAVKLIHRYLKRAYDNGSDVEARRGMLIAAYDAGVAFTKSYVGYVHAVAHSLGGKYGIAHGLANAVILPYFLEEYGASCHPQLAKLAREISIASNQDSNEVAANKFIGWVQEMNSAMNIPTHLEGILKEDIPFMAERADAEGNPLYPVPKILGKKELESMYYRIMKL